MIAVPITLEPSFRAGEPAVLFDVPYEYSWGIRANYDVTADGQRFVMIQSVDRQVSATQIDVISHWFEELEQLVP